MAEIRVIEKTVNAEVIDLLERTLVCARAGEITGIVLIESYNDNGTNHSWAGIACNAIRVTGETAIAMSALARAALGKS